MSRALFTKLPPFNSVFDEARVASTPTTVLKSVARSSVFAGSSPNTCTSIIYWSTLSSQTGLTLSNQAYGAGAGLIGSPIGTLSLIDTTLYNPQSVVEVDRTTLSTLRNSRFTVLQDGVYRISGKVALRFDSSVPGSITSTAASSAFLSVSLLRDDNVTITEMNRVVIPSAAGFIATGNTVVVPWNTVRPFASGTVLNIAYAVQGQTALVATSSITVAAAGLEVGAECHITREVTLVHAVPQ
jgi:hypothetical protein